MTGRRRSGRSGRSGRPRPTGRGLGLAAVLLGLLALCLATSTVQLVPLIVAVALPLVLAPPAAWWRARRARAALVLTASVSPAMAVVGGELQLHIRLSNHFPRRLPALWIRQPARHWQRRGPEGSGVAKVAALRIPRLVPSDLVSVGGAARGAASEVVATVGSGRRGVFELAAGPSWVLDGFGLFGACGPVVPGVCAVLYPAAQSGLRVPGGGLEAPGEGAVEPAPGGRDGAGELVGLRPYIEGDRLSLVHWRARARSGGWFVRQFAPERRAQTRLVLDDRPGVHRQADFEAMVAGAHGLIEDCFDEGATVELCTLSGRSATLAPVPVGLEEARVFLAGVLPRPRGAGGWAGRPGAPVERAPGGTVITTATGAPSLPGDVERIVVGP